MKTNWMWHNRQFYSLSKFTNEQKKKWFLTLPSQMGIDFSLSICFVTGFSFTCSVYINFFYGIFIIVYNTHWKLAFRSDGMNREMTYNAVNDDGHDGNNNSFTNGKRECFEPRIWSSSSVWWTFLLENFESFSPLAKNYYTLPQNGGYVRVGLYDNLGIYQNYTQTTFSLHCHQWQWIVNGKRERQRRYPLKAHTTHFHWQSFVLHNWAARTCVCVSVHDDDDDRS